MYLLVNNGEQILPTGAYTTSKFKHSPNAGGLILGPPAPRCLPVIDQKAVFVSCNSCLLASVSESLALSVSLACCLISSSSFRRSWSSVVALFGRSIGGASRFFFLSCAYLCPVYFLPQISCRLHSLINWARLRNCCTGSTRREY